MRSWLTYRSADCLRPAGFLLVAIVALLSLASLSELRVAQAQTPAGERAFLQPGSHLVGWLGEERPVQELFDAVPKLKSVSAWDASRQNWIRAHREPTIPGQAGQLALVRSGMALWVSIDGPLPVRWPYGGQSPASGLVELYWGGNLASWGGSNATTLAEAARGIGQSLDTAYVWEPEQGGWCRHRPGYHDTCVVDRGDAVWVNVLRDVNWLQPTGIRPNIQFLGNVTQHVRATVRNDLDAVMDLFASEFGIQADPSQFTIQVAADLQSLVAVVPDEKTRAIQDIQDLWARSSGWASVWDTNPKLVVKATGWEWYHRQAIGFYEGRYVLAHEYAHIVQFQLLGQRLRDVTHPQWIIEGGAWWLGWLLWIEDDKNRNRSEILIIAAEEFAKRNNTQLTLYDLEIRNKTHTHDLYRMGAWAVELAADTSSDQAVIEYWRQAGAAIVWDISSHPEKWHIPFERAFGTTAPKFYDQFRRWRDLAAVSGRVP